MTPPERKRVTTRLPAWLWNFDPKGFGEAAQLRLTGIASRAGFWEIQTDERYRSVAPHLVQFEDLGASPDATRFARLNELTAFLALGSRPGPDLETNLQRIVESRPNQMAALATAWMLRITTAPEGQAGKIAHEVFLQLGQLPDGDRLLFPDLKAHVVRINRALHYRYSLARIVVQAEAHPTRYDERPADADQPNDHFAAGRALLSGTYFLDPYLAPLLLADTPHLWALIAVRQGGVTLFNLGRFINGTSGEPAELLQMFGPPGAATFRPRVDLDPADYEAAARWWVQRIDRMFGLLADPVVFARDGVVYSPQGQLHTMLSVEQLFRHVQSILTQVRDSHVQRLAFFGFLDTLQKINGVDLVEACRLSYAQKILTKLEAAIDQPAAARLFLPLARRAVEALRAVQTEFRRQPDDAPGTIGLPDKLGVLTSTPLETAVAHYLHVRRNATHGFGGKDDGSRKRNEALLASHTGELPNELPLLAYLYVLHLVVETPNLGRQLRAASYP